MVYFGQISCLRSPLTYYPTGTYLKSTEILDLVTRTISYAGDMNSPRRMFHLATTTLGGSTTLLAIGGDSRNPHPPQASVEQFHPNNNSWTLVPNTLRKGRTHFAAVVVLQEMVCSTWEGQNRIARILQIWFSIHKYTVLPPLTISSIHHFTSSFKICKNQFFLSEGIVNTEGALRLPMKYDKHPIHPSKRQKGMLILSVQCKTQSKRPFAKKAFLPLCTATILPFMIHHFLFEFQAEE